MIYDLDRWSLSRLADRWHIAHSSLRQTVTQFFDGRNALIIRGPTLEACLYRPSEQ